MIRYDFHSHHARCGHAQGDIEHYVQIALALGLEEIGISDHSPLYWLEGDHPAPGTAMARSELEHYVAEVLALRQKYAGRIRVYLGLEVDYIEGMEEVYRAELSPYPFDYLLGSVHYVFDTHIYNTRRWRECEDPPAHYAEYFRLVRASARSGLFDVLGLITGLLAYGPALADELSTTEFDRTAAAIAESGVAIEVNTSGLRKGGPGPFPHPALLDRCIALGVPITYGSDSHLPSEVGHARDIAWPLIQHAKPWRPHEEGAALRRVLTLG